MDTHTHCHSKIDIDEWLLKELIVLNIIRDASHLSRECGKNPTYFACMRARGYGLHLGSLIFLSARLAKRIMSLAVVYLTVLVTELFRLRPG